MKKMLIATTINDSSLPLFLTRAIKTHTSVDLYFFHESLSILEEALHHGKHDYIYIRDPFNESFDTEDITRKVNIILEHSKGSYLIDKIQDVSDVFMEDKWYQYERFSDFMPKTALFEKLDDVDWKTRIVKKRISSRSKDVYFSRTRLPAASSDEFITQERIRVEKEYRVYVIFDEIILLAALKSPRTELQKCKVYDTEKIPDSLRDFVKNLLKRNTFDFIGLDIVKDKDRYALLEINRSCGFVSYFQKTGVNLAEVFMTKLLSTKIAPAVVRKPIL